jgi:hypothetical protein
MFIVQAMYNIINKYNMIFTAEGGEVCVLAKHHRKCKLADWSRPSNITSCSCVPGCATEEQAK